MIRILCVNASGHIAGAEAMLVDLLAGLDRARFTPLVLLPVEGELSAALRTAGIEARSWPLAAFRSRRELRSPAAVARLGRALPASVRAMARLIRAEGIGLVHTNSSVVLDGALAARRAGVPHLWHVREVLERPRGAWPLLRRLIPALSSRVLCVSPAVARHFGRLPGRLARRLEVVPDGVATARFAVPPRRAWPWPADAPVVGTVGRINGHKGQEDVLRAAALVCERVPAARFVLAGGALPAYADVAASLRRLAGELGLTDRVLFLGHQRRDEVAGVLAGLDVFVMPSRIVEGFGLAALEAMAAGLSVVGTDVGVGELVRDGVDGLVTPRGDHVALAAAITRLLVDPLLARRLGRAGQARARSEFAIERHVEAVEGFYAGAAGARRAPHAPAAAASLGT